MSYIHQYLYVNSMQNIKPTANAVPETNGWMDDLTILRPFQQYFSYIRTMGRYSERLCAMEPRLRLKRSSPQAGLELTTARSVGQYSYWGLCAWNSVEI